MSVITMANRQQRRAQTRGNANAIQAEESEFNGFWINVGVMTAEGNFARLNRGIAVDDLMTRRVYESTDPQYAAELALTNQIVTAIKKRATAKKLGEGEHIVLKNLTVVLYRRQEGSDMDEDAQQAADVENMLFGDDEDDADEALVPATKGKAKGSVTRTQIEADEDDDDVLNRKAR